MHGVIKILGIFLTLHVLHGCAFVAGSSWFIADSGSRGTVAVQISLELAGFVDHSPADLPLRVWLGGRRNEPAAGARIQTSPIYKEPPLAPVVVVFESDGAAWRGRGYIPPKNPTPERAVGAEIARAVAAHFSGPVIYVGRHCQFVGIDHARFTQDCVNPRLWAQARFSPKVIDEMRQVLSGLVQVHPDLQNRPWFFTGFSGGGTLAALVATESLFELSSTVCLVTFAAPLDLRQWVHMHGVTPLDESNDPADRIPLFMRLSSASFWFGSNDRVVPVESLGRLAGLAHRAGEVMSIRVVPAVGHSVVDPWVNMAAQRIEESCALVFDWSRLHS